MAWISIAVLVVAMLAAIVGVASLRMARHHPVTNVQHPPTIGPGQTALTGAGLALMAVLIVGFMPVNSWFLAPAMFAAAWVPQIARRAVSPTSAYAVAGMFTAAMVITIAIRMLVTGE
jgi:hypothetical protein